MDDAMVVMMVGVVVNMGVVVGKKIVGVKIVDEDYLVVVEVMEEDCSMNIQACFSTHHRQSLDHRIEK